MPQATEDFFNRLSSLIRDTMYLHFRVTIICRLFLQKHSHLPADEYNSFF